MTELERTLRATRDTETWRDRLAAPAGVPERVRLAIEAAWRGEA